MNSSISSSDSSSFGTGAQIARHRTFVRVLLPLVALGLLVLVLGGEAILRSRPTGAGDSLDLYRQRFLKQAGADIALGDSHVASGLPADGAVANLGWPSDNIATVIAKARLRQSLFPVKRVVLQADPHQFATYRLVARQQDRVDDLRKQRPSLPLRILEPNNRQYLLEYWRAFLMSLAGMAPAAGQAPDMRTAAALRVQLHTPVDDLAANPLMRAYEDFVDELTRAGIQVCMVGFPVNTAYRDVAAALPQFDAARRMLAKIAQDRGTPLADYWDAAPDDLFGAGDPDHLSPVGAAWLAARVGRDCGWDH